MFSEPNSDTSKSKSPEHVSKKLRLSGQESDVAVAYACKGHSKLGHLLFDKCVDLGVPSGPLLGDLKNGKDVTLPSGKIVHSKDVVSPEQVCPLFLVVECPSEDFLDPFVNEEKFKKYQKGAENLSEIASLVVHFTSPEILKSSEYQEWMDRFPDTTYHLILNNDCATLNSSAIHKIQYKLNLLHPSIFGLLQETEEKENSIENINKNIFQAQTLDRYFLRPAKGFDRSFALNIEPEDFIEEAMNADEFDKCLNQLQNKINLPKQPADEHFPAVAFLGTGSSIPNKARNVSAILVNTNKNKYMLLDCGEGTYGQLVRLYGKEIRKILLNMFCIFISHMHADHHLGLIKIFQEREKVFKSLELQSEPVILVGPNKLHAWLQNYYSNFVDPTPQYRFTTCLSLEHEPYFKSADDQGLKNCQDIVVCTVPVNHCPDAHGVIISSKSAKWKLVYSGDTTPCTRLVSAGQDCCLLIHEATMEDELKSEAILKRHSTTSEAIKIGEEMNSKYTILTHFSQRYAKVPLFSENFHNHIGCAFDNMKVHLNELYILPLLIPALKILFAEDVEELHTKGNKRRQKLELIKSLTDDVILKKID